MHYILIMKYVHALRIESELSCTCMLGVSIFTLSIWSTYLWNQSLSPPKLRVRTPFMARCTRYNIIKVTLNTITLTLDLRFFFCIMNCSNRVRYNIIKVTSNTITLAIDLRVFFCSNRVVFVIIIVLTMVEFIPETRWYALN